MSSPRLWSWDLSPFAGRARIALALRRVDVELIEVDPVARPARLAELNPANRVPVLELADTVVVQSMAICEWAQEVGSGPALWPSDPAARARARGLTRWVDDELTTNFFLSFRKQAFGLDATQDHPDLVENLRTTLRKRWRALERLLSATDGSWLMEGSDPTLADLSAMPLAVRLPEWGPRLAPEAESHPAAAAWLDRLREHPLAAEVTRRGEPVTA